jgi:hypothetical protein
MFVSSQLLRNGREQRPSNQGDFDSSVTGEFGRVYYTGVDLLLISCFSVVRDFVGLCFKWFIQHLSSFYNTG